MSVPLSKRTESNFDVVHNAVELRLKITIFLLRDFGIKNSKRTLEFLSKKHSIAEEDMVTINDLFMKYGIGDQILYEFPSWWVDCRRKAIDGLCHKLIREIELANGNWPNTRAELELRRTHQTEAIATIEAINAELEYVASVLHCRHAVDVSKFLPIIEMCDKEKNLLRKWRKSDNKRFGRLTD